MRYISLILKNSWRNKRRTILTVASVAISFCLLGVLLALYSALYLSDAPADSALRLVTRHKVSLAQVLPMYYEARIRQVPGVKEVVASQWFGGVYKDSRDQRNFFARFATEPEKLFKVYTDFKIPPDQLAAFIRDRQGCVAGRALADRFGWKLGDRITLKGDIFPIDLELILRGIYDHPSQDESLYFNFDYLYQGLPEGRRDFAGAFTILVDSPDDVPRVAKTIDDTFRNAPSPTRTETEKQFALSFVSFLGNVKLFLLGLCGAVTFTILLVSANTMAMSVRERFREVGVLKTLGFTQFGVLGIILGEASFISLLGGALGLVLASWLCLVVRHAPSFVAEIKTLSIQPGLAGVCLLAAAALGLIASVVPALSAARAPIVESLRVTD